MNFNQLTKTQKQAFIDSLDESDMRWLRGKEKRMKKPTKEEITKAREQVEWLFRDSGWFEVMKCWEGVGWHRSDVMCGMLVGLRIASNRRRTRNKEKTHA